MHKNIVDTTLLNLFGNETVSYIQMSKTTYKIIFVVPSIVGICYAWYGYNYYTIYYENYFPGIGWMVLLLLACFGSVFIGFLSTNIMGCQGLLMNAVVAVSSSHKELSMRLNDLVVNRQEYHESPMIQQVVETVKKETKPEEKDCKNDDEKTIINLFSKAYKLSVQQEKMNSVFSKVVLLMSTYFLISITLFSYGFLIVLVTKMNMLKISSVISHVLLFLFYLFSFFSLCSIGQDFVDGQVQTSNALNRAYFMFKGQFKTETENYLEFVKEKLEKPIALSHYSFFKLDRSGFLATLALIFTYLIVLLQFKTTE